MQQQLTDPIPEAEHSEDEDSFSSMPPLELVEDSEEEELPILPPQLHTYPPGWLHLLSGIVGAPFPFPEAAQAIEDLSQNQDVRQGRPQFFQLSSYEYTIF